MKKFKNLFMIMAIAILTVIVTPTNVLASELITEVRVTMNPIKVGNTISMTATLTAEPAAAVYKTNMPLSWVKSDNSDGSSGEIVTSGTFEADKYYWWDFSYGFNIGYYTDSNTKYYVNDVEYVYNSWVQPEKIKITEIKLTGPEIKSGNSMSSLVNIEATPKDAISNTSISLIWYENDTSLSSFDTFVKFMNQMPATGNFVEEKYYIINTLALPGFLTINSGYELGNGVKYYYNGEEVASVSITGTLAYNWIEAEKTYTYKYLSGDNQEFTNGELDSYIFTIDGDYEQFESLKIGDISLVKDTDYIVAEGSTIITLTATGITKLNTLTSGTYNVETKFTGNTVTGKLIIKDEAKQEENNQTEETTETIEENPDTGDKIISSVILGGISLISLFGCGLYINKQKKYN